MLFLCLFSFNPCLKTKKYENILFTSCLCYTIGRYRLSSFLFLLCCLQLISRIIILRFLLHGRFQEYWHPLCFSWSKYLSCPFLIFRTVQMTTHMPPRLGMFKTFFGVFYISFYGLYITEHLNQLNHKRAIGFSLYQLLGFYM